MNSDKDIGIDLGRSKSWSQVSMDALLEGDLQRPLQAPDEVEDSGRFRRRNRSITASTGYAP